MRPVGTKLRLVFPGVVCALLYLPPTYAQLPQRLERCLPYPTYAQEVRAMDEEVAAKSGFKEPRPRIMIDVVRFDGPIHIPDSAKQELIAELKQHDFDAYGDWMQEVQDVRIMAVWRDYGYFKAAVAAEAAFISSDSAGMHVSITARVEEGLQYHLGSVQFRSSDPDVPLAFRLEELRQTLPLNDGDLFSAAQIRAGLDALKHLYGSSGYIDDSRQRISLTMELDQQKQFRLRTIEVFGLDPGMESLLRARLKTGDIYNWQVVEDFLKQNASALPPDISPLDIGLHRDVRNGTVDLRFNLYQGCPNLHD